MDASPRIILVTGAASGIGRAFALHYSTTEPRSSIIALDINQQPPSDLLSGTRSRPGNIFYHPCDITDPRAITETLRKQLGDPSNPPKYIPIDLVILSAGIRGLVPELEAQKPENVAAAETWTVMNKDTLMRTFEINAAGTFLFIQACLPYLRKESVLPRLSHESGGVNGYSERNERPKVVVMGSRMGSMSYNTTGGGYAYRASKAALNAVVKSFSIDVPEVVFTVVHPGRVESRLVKIKEEGAISAEESLGDMLPLIERLDWRDTGRYVDRFGKDIGW